MDNDRRHAQDKTKLAGPWRSVHGAIWLLGIATLAMTGWWWPGILVLVALSTLVEAGLAQIPGAVAPDPPDAAQAGGASHEHDPARLPDRCQACGAPVQPGQVQWTSAVTARCSYCGTNLQMRSP